MPLWLCTGAKWEEPGRCGGVINSSLSAELWERQVTCATLIPLLILYCHIWLLGQADALCPQHSIWLKTLNFLGGQDRCCERKRKWYRAMVFTQGGCEHRVCMQQQFYPWLILLLDEVWARDGAGKARLCRFRPDSCNVIFLCYPCEIFIIRTACLGMEEPREEMWFAFRHSSCWPSPIFCKWDGIILQSQPLTTSILQMSNCLRIKRIKQNGMYRCYLLKLGFSFPTYMSWTLLSVAGNKSWGRAFTDSIQRRSNI